MPEMINDKLNNIKGLNLTMLRFKLSLLSLTALVLVTSCSKLDENTIARIDGNDVPLEEFTSANPASVLADADTEKLNEAVDVYIKRKVYTHAALEEGFAEDPMVLEKKTRTERRHLMDYVYDKDILDQVISDDMLREVYDKSSEELKARHILVQFKGSGRSRSERSRAEAEKIVSQIQARLKKGEDFSVLAEEFTEDPSGKASGGDLGWFGWGRMVGPFQDAAFALRKGEVSAPIETEFGFHIIRLDDRRPVSRGSFEEEKDRLRQMEMRSRQPELSALADKFVDERKKEAGFKLNDTNIHYLFEIYNGADASIKNMPMDEALTHIGFADPLFTLNGEDQNYFWVLKALDNIDQEQRPRFRTENQLRTLLEQLVIRDLIVQYGYKQNYQNEAVFKNKTDEFTKVLAHDAFVVKKINEPAEPSEEELEAYYEEHKTDKYMDKKKVKVSEIFVKDSLLAVDLKKRIDAGEDIGKLAERYSERKATKDNGGQLPAFQEGRYGNMGAVAFTLNPGDVAGPVKLGNGFSVLRLDEQIPEQPFTYNRVKGRVKTELTNERRKEISDKLFRQLKRKFSVKVNYGAVHDFYASEKDA